MVASQRKTEVRQDSEGPKAPLPNALNLKIPQIEVLKETRDGDPEEERRRGGGEERRRGGKETLLLLTRNADFADECAKARMLGCVFRASQSVVGS